MSFLLSITFRASFSFWGFTYNTLFLFHHSQCQQLPTDWTELMRIHTLRIPARSYEQRNVDFTLSFSPNRTLDKLETVLAQSTGRECANLKQIRCCLHPVWTPPFTTAGSIWLRCICVSSVNWLFLTCGAVWLDKPFWLLRWQCLSQGHRVTRTAWMRPQPSHLRAKKFSGWVVWRNCWHWPNHKKISLKTGNCRKYRFQNMEIQFFFVKKWKHLHEFWQKVSHSLGNFKTAKSGW